MLLTPSVHVTENWKCSFWSLYYKTKKEQENMWVLVTTLGLVLKGLKKKDLDCITRGNIRIRGLDVSAKIIMCTITREGNMLNVHFVCVFYPRQVINT